MRTTVPITLAAQLAQVDPSWLQFIGREFREFLGGGTSDAMGDGFDPADFPLIQRIYRRLVHEGETPDAIRGNLWQEDRRTRVIAVTSGKGGVGKTTISVNLAVACARQGRRVLLVDADLGMANVHVYAGVQPRGTVLEVIDGTRTLADAVVPGPGGIDILCGQSGVVGAADLDPRWIEFLGSELRRANQQYDVLFIDTGAGISTQVMSFLALADDIVVVATPNLASTLDAYGVVKVARETNIGGRIHILVNEADSAAQAETVLTRIAACSRQFLQFEPGSLGHLGRDPAFESFSQSRTPLVLAAPEHECARRFAELARKLTDHGQATRGASPPCPAAA